MRIFIAYAQFPETDKNAGGMRVFEILKMLAEARHSVTFMTSSENDIRYRKAVEDLGIDCLSDADRSLVGDVEEFGAYLREQQFPVAVFVQYFIYNRYAPYFRMLLPDCRLVYDALDLEFVRCEREAQVLGTKEAREYASRVKEEEIATLKDCDAVWTVTEVEKQTALALVPDKRVDVIPTIHEVDPDLPGYDARDGIVFLGSYHHRPNLDAIHYFMADIFPQIRTALPEVKFLIAGAAPTDDLYQYEKQWTNVKVTGYIEDHRALLKSCRVGIAPLRFGAGMKGKIGEYMGCGLPCVTSSVGAEGIGLTHEKEVLIANTPDDFASCVIRLYSDTAIWEKLAHAGASYINTFSHDSIAPRVIEAVRAASELPVRAQVTSAGNIFSLLRRPGDVWRWIGTAGRAVRRGGIRELVKQFRVWLRRPSA